jgi:16S rRNA (adenine1518-N6/adenine1519-N6)-dimethyltransferase
MRRAATSADRRPATSHVPRKRFGQHFLERAWVDKLIGLIEPKSSDTFLEIGAGRGALTAPLAEAAAHVIAYEIDRDLARALRGSAPSNLMVVEGDFLEITAERLRDVLSYLRLPASSPLRVAGNLPYNVASPILFKLIALYRAGVALEDATLMLQREVADRLLAAPGSRDYGALSVLVGFAARVERRLALPPGAFRPPPKVDSAVVRLQFHPDEPHVADRAAFEALVRTVFTRRRKTLANALLAFRPDDKRGIHDALARSGLDGSRRPESLSMAEFARLVEAFGPTAP